MRMLRDGMGATGLMSRSGRASHPVLSVRMRSVDRDPPPDMLTTDPPQFEPCAIGLIGTPRTSLG
jgi:hypothetical protein